MFRLATRGVNVSNAFPMSVNQRKWERRSVAVDFTARDSQGVGHLVFTSADLSAGGTFLKADMLLEEGEELNVEFRLPQHPTAIKVEARVAWVRRFPQVNEPAGMGVEFVDLDEADREAMVAFLSHHE